MYKLSCGLDVHKDSVFCKQFTTETGETNIKENIVGVSNSVKLTNKTTTNLVKLMANNLQQQITSIGNRIDEVESGLSELE
jgi:hypothetical protein